MTLHFKSFSLISQVSLYRSVISENAAKILFISPARYPQKNSRRWFTITIRLQRVGKNSLRIASSRHSVSWDVARKTVSEKNRQEVRREKATLLHYFFFRSPVFALRPNQQNAWKWLPSEMNWNRSLQLHVPHIPVTAFSQTNLFLVSIYLE